MSNKVQPKDFKKAFNDLVASNLNAHESAMISKADALKAKKAMMAPTLEEVAKRLWDCHDKHLGRVDQLRQ